MGIPAALLLLAGAVQEDPERFASKEGNYSLLIPPGWQKLRGRHEVFQLALTKGGNFIGFAGLEGESTPELLVGVFEEEQKAQDETFEVQSKTELKIAGERAVVVRASGTRNGLKMRFACGFFCHQGIAYRAVGVHALGKAQEFDKEFIGMLASVRFTAERKAWVAKFVGTPARSGLLGGRALFELHRPRWSEFTFEDENEGWPYVEQASFAFLPGAAWIKLRAKQTEDDEAAETEALRHELAGRLAKARVEPRFVKAADGERRYLLIQGEYQNVPHQFRAAVLVRGGFALHAWQEAQGPQAEAVLPDWERFLAGLAFDLPGAEPPAYAVKGAGRERRPRPALAAWIAKAQRLHPESDVLAVSTDGARALASSDAGTWFVTFASGKRESLALDPAPAGWAEWSPDRRRLLYGDAAGLYVAELDPLDVRRVAPPVDRAAFGPEAGSLVVVAGPARPGLYASRRLERLIPGEGTSKVLAEHALARFAFPAVSPDGKRLAFVSNRDYPRSALQGGHLCTAGVDGAGFRSLTTGPEEIRAVRWSADGTRLYIVRRVSEGDAGAVSVRGGGWDLWRVSPETGAAVNLTRSGHVENVWVVEDGLALAVGGWDLPSSQRGLFRIGADELEKVTASRPVPPLHRPRAASAAVAARVREAVGGAVLRDLVPTPALMDKAAAAFAAAATEQAGLRLDFSADSLDLLHELAEDLDLGGAGDPVLILGLGAYYGETLRKAGGAAWALDPVPFGDWAPSTASAGNPLVEAVSPFADVVAMLLGSEERWLKGAEDVGTGGGGEKLVLVHPPSAGERAVAAAAGPGFVEAWKKLDAGETGPALDLLRRELEKNPRNRALARTLIELYDATGQAEFSKAVARQAVEAGTEVPEILLRHAEGLDPKAAIPVLRRGAGDDWPQAEILLRLAAAYAATGNRPFAESCWRRAHRSATPAQKAEILKQLAGGGPRSEE